MFSDLGFELNCDDTNCKYGGQCELSANGTLQCVCHFECDALRQNGFFCVVILFLLLFYFVDVMLYCRFLFLSFCMSFVECFSFTSASIRSNLDIF